MRQTHPAKRAVLRSGLKQTFIAREMGIHTSRLSRVLNGHMDATETEKRLLAATLRCSVSDLFPEAEAVAS